MKIVFHIGAHRTATTSFQSFLWDNRDRLARSGLTVWTPRRTRDGLMSGMMKHPALITLPDEERAQRSVGRIRMEVERLARLGQKALLISEENICGSVMNNLAERRLYPLLDERLRRYRAVLGGQPCRVGLAIRSYDAYWTSALVYAMTRGHAAPDPDLLDMLVTQPRRWRTLVREIASGLPGAAVTVWTFERMGTRPPDLLAGLSGMGLPPGLRDSDGWHNRSTDRAGLEDLLALRGEALPNEAATRAAGDRWMPFSEAQRAVLRADYTRDLAWLRAGADGLAQFIDGQPMPAPDRGHTRTASSPPPGALPIGGPRHGIETGLGRPRPQGIARSPS